MCLICFLGLLYQMLRVLPKKMLKTAEELLLPVLVLFCKTITLKNQLLLIELLIKSELDVLPNKIPVLLRIWTQFSFNIIFVWQKVDFGSSYSSDMAQFLKNCFENITGILSITKFVNLLTVCKEPTVTIIFCFHMNKTNDFKFTLKKSNVSSCFINGVYVANKGYYWPN